MLLAEKDIKISANVGDPSGSNKTVTQIKGGDTLTKTQHQWNLIAMDAVAYNGSAIVNLNGNALIIDETYD